LLRLVVTGGVGRVVEIISAGVDVGTGSSVEPCRRLHSSKPGRYVSSDAAVVLAVGASVKAQVEGEDMVAKRYGGMEKLKSSDTGCALALSLASDVQREARR
jgi:hypothetical protein